MQHVLLVAQQVAILFILIGVGAAAAKTGVVKRDGAAMLTSLVLYFATPCAIVKAFFSIRLTTELLGDFAMTALLASVITLAGFLLSYVLFRGENKPRGAVLRMSVAFPNCGFMGIPLGTALLGPESVAYLSIYIVMFNLFAWTLGVRLFKPESKPSVRTILVNPGIIGLAGGIITMLYGREIPVLLASPIESIGSLNTPLAMLVLGYYVAGASFRLGKDTLPVALTIAARQFIIPLAVLGAAWLMNVRGFWFMSAMIAGTAPPALNGLMFAQRFGGDAELGAMLITYANLVSVVSMSIMLGLCFQFFA